MAKYINPYTDFGFKKFFGEEGNKDLLKSALETAVEEKQIEIAKNAILEGAGSKFIAKITGLTVELIDKLRAELKKQN